MTFQGVRFGRVFQALAVLLGVGFVAFMGLTFAATFVWLWDDLAGATNANRIHQIEAGAPVSVFRAAVGADGDTWYYGVSGWRFGWIPEAQVSGADNCPTPADSPGSATGCAVTNTSSRRVDIRIAPDRSSRAEDEIAPGARKNALMQTADDYIFVFSGWVNADDVAFQNEDACADLPVIARGEYDTAAICTVAAIKSPSDLRSNPDPVASQAQQQAYLQEATSDLWAEFSDDSGKLNRVINIHGILMVLATFLVTRWTAGRNATSIEQGVGYGLAIGFGAMLFYGMCLCGSADYLVTRLILWLMLLGAATLGGQFGGQSAQKRKPSAAPAYSSEPLAPSSSRPDMAYNLGVAAAMGGRREEAREHFTRVLQNQPRNLAAWLQLANLADTPEQAWNYIQQARAINANDPAVQEAVSIIWPQVQANLQRKPPATNQPPYSGGAQDDTEIPRSTLPGDDET